MLSVAPAQAGLVLLSFPLLPLQPHSQRVLPVNATREPAWNRKRSRYETPKVSKRLAQFKLCLLMGTSSSSSSASSLYRIGPSESDSSSSLLPRPSWMTPTLGSPTRPFLLRASSSGWRGGRGGRSFFNSSSMSKSSSSGL